MSNQSGQKSPSSIHAGIERYASFSVAQIPSVIAALPARPTPVLVGEPGVGKTAVLRDLIQLPEFKDHQLRVLEGATLEAGDVCLPRVVAISGKDSDKPDEHILRTITHESLGFHSDRPQLIFIDEFGKTSPPVKNALLSVIYEHRMGNLVLPPGSRVICAANQAEHLLRDNFAPHEINRLMFIKVTKPTVAEWVEWARKNDVPEIIIAWVRSNPMLLDNWSDGHNNPFIFSTAPKEKGNIFVSPRSLAAFASVYAKVKDSPILALGSGLFGLAQSTIGTAAAQDFISFKANEGRIPSFSSIFADPLTTPLPTAPTASRPSAMPGMSGMPGVSGASGDGYDSIEWDGGIKSIRLDRAACLYLTYAAVSAIKKPAELEAFLIYIGRIEDPSICALFLRDLAENKEKMPLWAASPAFTDALLKHGIGLGG